VTFGDAVYDVSPRRSNVVQ